VALAGPSAFEIKFTRYMNCCHREHREFLQAVGSLSTSFQVQADSLGRVTGEDRVASFDCLVRGKAGVEHGLVSRFAVLIKLSEPQAARRGVLF
jgi:hypothetical protein